MVAIGTMYTHAPDADDAGNLPDGPDGASDANVACANKARELLSCVRRRGHARLAAHGNSMGAFVTGQLLGRYTGIFRAASHTSGGVSQGPERDHSPPRPGIRTPYQLHHSAADTTVALIQVPNLAQILAGNGYPTRSTWPSTRATRTHRWASTRPCSSASAGGTRPTACCPSGSRLGRARAALRPGAGARRPAPARRRRPR